MPSLDVFKSDNFSCVEMTTAINLAPFAPGRIGQLGIFRAEPVATTTVLLENMQGRISLIPNQVRGSLGAAQPPQKRIVRSLACTHLPMSFEIKADEVQNVRAFGTESELLTVQKMVTQKLAQARQDHEITQEYHRMGAVKGIVLDADGSTTIYNLFTEFGLTQTSVNFALGTAGTEIKNKIATVRRAIEVALGAQVYTGLHCFCGDAFFDALVVHPMVKDAYQRWQDGQYLRDSQLGPQGFQFCGVTFENYRGKVGSVDFVGANDAHFIPLGVPDLFVAHYAPADYIETVNTLGKPFYAKQHVTKFDKGVEVETQSNPLMICNRPQCLVKGTVS